MTLLSNLAAVTAWEQWTKSEFDFEEPVVSEHRPLCCGEGNLEPDQENEEVRMETKEITRNVWRPFLDDFSRQHQGETATIHVIGEDVGAQYEAESLPFVGITSEDAGSEKGAIAIVLGTEPNDHIDHRISDPTHVRITSTRDRVKDTLEIEAADGTKTILQLQPPPMLS
jgi:hypothetical protein